MKPRLSHQLLSVRSILALSSIKRSTLQRKWCSSQRQQLSVVHVGTSNWKKGLGDKLDLQEETNNSSRLFEDLKR